MDIERLKELVQAEDSDLWDYKVELIGLLDEAIAHQSVTEMAVCPNCNGSGVYQEYDEYDRYYLHACYKCEGTGEIARQSMTSEEVAEAIEQFRSEYVDDFEGYPATCEKWNRKG